MVIGVLEVELDHVVIDVLDGQGNADPGVAHLEVLESGHRPGRVLEQRLIDTQRNFAARRERPAHSVLLEDSQGQIRGHTGTVHIAIRA